MEEYRGVEDFLAYALRERRVRKNGHRLRIAMKTEAEGSKGGLKSGARPNRVKKYAAGGICDRRPYPRGRDG